MNDRQTIYAFIDSQNLNASVLTDLINKEGNIIYKGWLLDFKKFFVYLKDKYKVEKVFLFIGRIPGNEAMYNFLEGVGYKVVYKPTITYTDEENETSTKGNVDAELVLHTMIEFPNYDKAIIVSGDGDYYCLIEYLDAKKKLANIIIPNEQRFSSLLSEYRPYHVYVNNLKSKLERIRK